MTLGVIVLNQNVSNSRGLREIPKTRTHVHVSYLHDNRASDNVIHGPKVKRVLHIKVKVLLVWTDGAQQFCDVVGVERAGLRGQAAGQVRVPNMGHTLRKREQSHF